MSGGKFICFTCGSDITETEHNPDASPGSSLVWALWRHCGQETADPVPYLAVLKLMGTE